MKSPRTYTAKLSADAERIERLERIVNKQQQMIVRYLSKNSDLWLQLSKLPGGLEAARRLQPRHRTLNG